MSRPDTGLGRLEESAFGAIENVKKVPIYRGLARFEGFLLAIYFFFFNPGILHEMNECRFVRGAVLPPRLGDCTLAQRTSTTSVRDSFAPCMVN